MKCMGHYRRGLALETEEEAGKCLNDRKTRMLKEAGKDLIAKEMLNLSSSLVRV